MPDYSGLINSNYGLLTGVTEGLRSAIGGFRDARRDIHDDQQQALENQMKKKMYAYDVAKSGLQESNDGSGNLTFTTSPQELDKEKRAAAEKRGMLKYQSDLTAQEDRRKAEDTFNRAVQTKGIESGQNFQVGPKGFIQGASPIPGFNNAGMKGPLGKANEKEFEKTRDINRRYETAVPMLESAAKEINDPKTPANIKQERAIQVLNMLKDTAGASGEGGLRGEAYKDARGLLDYLPLHRPDKLSFGPQFGTFTEMLNQKAKELRALHDQKEQSLQGLMQGYQPRMLGDAMMTPGGGNGGIDTNEIEKEIQRRGLRGSK